MASPGRKMKECLLEIKPDIVHCSGVEEMLRNLESFFCPDDCQKIRCLLTNKGPIAAWDHLVDTLKSAGEDAFMKFRDVLHKNKCFSEIRVQFENICELKGVGVYIQENSSSDDDTSSVVTNQDLPLEEVSNRFQGKRSIDSVTSWSSLESEACEVFGSRQSSTDDTKAIMKRERFGSSGSRNNSSGSRGSFQLQNHQKDINVQDGVQHLPVSTRRKLSGLLNHKNCINKDWCAVAAELRMDNSVFQSLANSEDQMDNILEYMRHERMTIGDLVDVFKSINSKECIIILVEDGGVQGIPEESFKRRFSEEESHPLQETENSGRRPVSQDYSNEKSLIHENKFDKIARIQREENGFANHGSNIQQETEGSSKRTLYGSDKKEKEEISLNKEKNLELKNETRGLRLNNKIPTKSNQFKDFSEKEKQDFRSVIPKDIKEVRPEESTMSPNGFVLPINDATFSRKPAEKNINKQIDKINSDSLSCEYGCCDGIDEESETNSVYVSDGKGMGMPMQSNQRKPNIADLPPRIFSKAVDRVVERTPNGQDQGKDDKKQHMLTLTDNQDVNSKVIVQQANLEPDEKTSMGKDTSDFRQTFDSLEVKGRLISSDKDVSTNSAVNHDAINAGNMLIGDNTLKASKFDAHADEAASTEISVVGPKVFECPHEYSLKSGNTDKSVRKDFLHDIESGNHYTMFGSAWYEQPILKLLDIFGWGRRPVFPDRIVRGHKEGIYANTSKATKLNQLSPSENLDSVEQHQNGNIEEKTYFDSIDLAEKCCLAESETVVSHGKQTRKRYALIISNTNYKMLPKLTTSNGCSNLEVQLKNCGWEVELHVDVKKQDFSTTVNLFEEKVKNQVAVIFFFGHSVQMQGCNYLLPVGVDIESIKTVRKLNRHAYNLDLLRQKASNAVASIIFVDAGRQLEGCKPGFADVKPINNQCVLFSTSEDINNRFTADKLANAIGSKEDCYTLSQLIKPFENEFISPSSVSRCYMPISLKAVEISQDDCDVPGLRIPMPECPRHAFIFKAKRSIDDLQNIRKKWTIHSSHTAADLEKDFEAFTESLNEDSPKICLFYYEGTITMENHQLFLVPDNNNKEEKVEVSWILESLSETISGPRIVIINGIGADEFIDESNFLDLNLQEVFFAISAKFKTSQDTEMYFSRLAAVLGQDGYLKRPLQSLGNEFHFHTICNSLFYA